LQSQLLLIIHISPSHLSNFFSNCWLF